MIVLAAHHTRLLGRQPKTALDRVDRDNHTLCSLTQTRTWVWLFLMRRTIRIVADLSWRKHTQ
eukprot:SAG11_NODE_3712_length_2266_cov_16.035072_5_plen_62_part_01